MGAHTPSLETLDPWSGKNKLAKVTSDNMRQGDLQSAGTRGVTSLEWSERGYEFRSMSQLLHPSPRKMSFSHQPVPK